MAGYFLGGVALGGLGPLDSHDIGEARPIFRGFKRC